MKISLAGISAFLGAAFAAPLAAQTPSAQQSFAGPWLHITTEMYQGSMTGFYVSKWRDHKNNYALARVLVIDSAAQGGVRTNVEEHNFHCGFNDYARNWVKNFDARHRFVSQNLKGPLRHARPLTPMGIALAYACTGDAKRLTPVTGDVQAYADSKFRAGR